MQAMNAYIDTIRHATLVDLPAMDRIEQESFSTPWNRDLIRGAIYNSRYEVRVVQPGARPVLGFYIAHTVNQRGNLDNLAVDQRERQRGLGRQLIDDWIARARSIGLASLTLQVNTANLVAQTLYLDYGFRVQRQLRTYYTNGDDALDMELAFESPHVALPASPRQAQGRRGI
jgi:ribosomal-protein-alanine N-acetyltransferase